MSRDMVISKEHERGTHTRRWGCVPLGGGTGRGDRGRVGGRERERGGKGEGEI